MRVKHLTKEQHDAFLAYCKEHHKNEPKLSLLAILATTGIRAEELARVTFEDLDLIKGTVNVKAAKGSKNRQLHLIDWVKDALKSYSVGLEDASIFIMVDTENAGLKEAHKSYSGRHNIKQMLRNYWRSIRSKFEAGSISMHGLRHSIAMRMLEGTNGDIRAVQSVLGHRNINNTICYLDYVDSLKAGSVLKGLFK